MMRILIILVFLLTRSTCYGDATGKRNQIKKFLEDDSISAVSTQRIMKIVDREEEQNPNDPKYQEMAKELLRTHLHLKEKDTKSVTVDKVTIQEVAGIITRLRLEVLLANGKSSKCKFKVWEQLWIKVKHVSYKCNALFSKKILTLNHKPGPEQVRDPKNPKYQKLAESSLDAFVATPGHTLKKEDVKAINVMLVTAQISSKIIIHVKFNIITVDRDNFKCNSTIVETPWNANDVAKVSFVNCTLIKADELSTSLLKLPTSSRYKLLTKEKAKNIRSHVGLSPKSRRLANESFQYFIKTNKQKIKAHRFQINKVTAKPVNGDSAKHGTIIEIDYGVFTSEDDILQCHSIIKEPPKLIPVKFDVDCIKEEDPTDNKFLDLTLVSFLHFMREIYDGPILHLQRLNVIKVTTQLHTGDLEIDFIVILNYGDTFPCHSKIKASVPPIILVQCQENNRTRAVEFQTDKSDSFESPDSMEGLDVTERPQSYEIPESYEIPDNSKESELDPNKEELKTLAEEAVKKHLTESHSFVFAKTVKNIKTVGVTSVKTQMSREVIIYIKIKAVTSSDIGDYGKYRCSVVYGTSLKKIIYIDCTKNTELLNKWCDPSKKIYLKYANKSLKKVKNNLSAGTYDVIVTYATSFDFGIRIMSVNFNVRPLNGPELKCHTRVFEEGARIHEARCNLNK